MFLSMLLILLGPKNYNHICLCSSRHSNEVSLETSRSVSRLVVKGIASKWSGEDAFMFKSCLQEKYDMLNPKKPIQWDSFFLWK